MHPPKTNDSDKNLEDELMRLLDEFAYTLILQDARELDEVHNAAGNSNETSRYILVNRIPVPCPDWREWEAFMKNKDRLHRLVKADQLRDGIRVSTVFLGLNYDPSRKQEPLLFETVVLGGKFNQYRKGYASWTEAEEGHQRCVERVRSSLKPDD